ncbi:MAG: hypothetical protein ACKPKO_40125, partial [Candidatus Fonsibacter sp.]
NQLQSTVRRDGTQTSAVAAVSTDAEGSLQNQRRHPVGQSKRGPLTGRFCWQASGSLGQRDGGMFIYSGYFWVWQGSSANNMRMAEALACHIKVTGGL